MPVIHNQITATAACLSSLGSALASAGGTVPVKELHQMTAMQLIELIGPNGIRFTYNKGEVCE